MVAVPEKFRLSTYDYELPRELIAQQPAHPRDSSRLLVLDADGNITEAIFRDLPKFLKPGDLLVLNDTKVYPVRLFGRKPTGGRVELLLIENEGEGLWRALVRPGRRTRAGTEVRISEDLWARIVSVEDDGSRLVKFSLSGKRFWDELERVGHTPLPPYIDRPDTEADRHRYQTVYASSPWSVAAPTAGLHFTEELLKTLRKCGVRLARITLNVGWGTFKPIEVEDIREHRMHREYFSIPAEAAEQINSVRAAGGRVIAVGTTTTRALETAARKGLPVKPQSGWTELYIYPSFEFKVVDGMITNFHLPKSSLIVMVSAFAGIENIKRAYAYAISRRFRFYSYGDAMLLWRARQRK